MKGHVWTPRSRPGRVRDEIRPSPRGPACGLHPVRQGVDADGRPEDRWEYEVDRTICQGEVAKADSASAPAPRRFQAADDIFAGCMAQHGYVNVSREEGEARFTSRSRCSR